MKANVLVLAALCLSVIGLEAVIDPVGSQATTTGMRASVRVGGAPIGQSGQANSMNPERGADLTQGVATFRPARRGARVVIERQTADGWTRVASGKQDRRGSFRFLADAGPADRPFVFRARTETDGGKALVSKPTVAEPATLYWHDEFDGRDLDPVWQFRPAPSAARTCSQVRVDNTTVSGGTANLTQTEMSGPPTATCPHGRFWTAMVGTQSTKLFRYGTFAARMKFHRPRGMHGAFWIQRTGFPVGAEPNDPANNGAEIDVIEYFGDGAGKGGLGQTVWWTDRDEAGELIERSVGGRLRAAADALGSEERPFDGYHVYSVEWTPDEYVLRVDGEETLRLDQGVSQIPEHLVLSLISSDWEIPNYIGGAPATMKVDWVRVWK